MDQEEKTSPLYLYGISALRLIKRKTRERRLRSPFGLSTIDRADVLYQGAIRTCQGGKDTPTGICNRMVTKKRSIA